MIENNLQRLRPEDQRPLEAASAAGIEFSAAVVAAALERPLCEVDDSCTRLARHQQFVGAAGMAAWPDGTVASRFRFHHSLYADVLYHRIAASHRAELHRRIAEREEAAYGDQAREIAAKLAHHYTEARLIERAIAYWQRAGRRASERSANTEAISHFRKGLELLNSTPDSVEHSLQELRLQMALGLSLSAVKGYTAPEAGKTYARALELCRQLNKTPQLFSVLVVLMGFNVIRGDLRTARELAEQLLRLAENLQASGLLQDAHYMIGAFFLIRGELLQSRKHLEQAITLYDPRQHPVTGFHDSGVEGLSQMGGTLWLLGYPDQALKRIRESLTAARQLSLPFILAFALTEAAGFDQLRGEMETTQEQAEELIALSCKEGFTLREGQGVALRGWALAKQGRNEDGIAQIRQGLVTIEATGARLYQLRVLGILAEACKEIRQPQEGLIVLAEAFDLANEIGPSFSEPELYRLKGELLLMQDESNSVQAESCFQRAIEVAQKQNAKSWELRATTSFSRLLARQGRRDKARSMLAEIYRWFTEGLDTADLKEAQTLLKELGGTKNGWFT